MRILTGQLEVGLATVVVTILLSLTGCERLNEVFEQGADDPTPTPTSYSSGTTPKPSSPTPGDKPVRHVTPTPTFLEQTATPTDDGGAEFVTEVGVNREFRLGDKTSGTFYFEARGFIDEYYPGDESWMKPVYFWIYNDHSGFDYDGSGFLFQVLQLMHAGYYCDGGKLHFRNHGVWLGEICYQHPWDDDRWYYVEITWANKYIHLYIDGAKVASGYTNSINGPITAGIGWPPARRHGVEGLEYRNIGYY